MTRKIKYLSGQMYEYELYKLVDSYDPMLKRKLDPFVFDGSDKNREQARFLAVSLIETMSAKNGIGLAANQVGLNYRLFVVGSEGVGFAFFNPDIISTEGEEDFREGCLSFPGLFLPIKRPASVTIKYQDMNGETKQQSFSGLTARTVLHEYDHLEGITYTSLVSPIILDHEKGKIKNNLKKLKAQKEFFEKQALIRKATENVVLQEKLKLNVDQELDRIQANSQILKGF